MKAEDWTVPSDPEERLIAVVVNQYQEDELPIDPDWARLREAYWQAERLANQEVHHQGGVYVTGIRGALALISDYHDQLNQNRIVTIRVDTLRLALQWANAYNQNTFRDLEIGDRVAFGVARREIKDAIEDYESWQVVKAIDEEAK